MQHVAQIAWHRAAAPCTAPPRLPPPPRRLLAAPPASRRTKWPNRFYPRRQQPLPEFTGEAEEEGAWGQPEEKRDEMQLWMDRLASVQPTERSVAVAQLLRIEEEGAFAGLVGGSPGADTDEAVPSEAEAEEEPSPGQQRRRQEGDEPWGRGLDPRNKRAVTDLVASVTRWRRRLDYIIEACSGRRMADLDAPLRQILRVGALELIEKQAPSHSVNEHVELAKQVMHKGSAGVANFVLREIVRRQEAGTLPQPPAPTKGTSPEEAAEALAVGASHPTWLVAGWLQQYGPKATMELLRWNNRKPHYAVRLAPELDPAAVCQRLEGMRVMAQPSHYLPREFITVQNNMQALLSSGLISSGKGQVQVSVIVIGSHWKLLNDAAWREGSREALLSSGLISSGKGQVQVSVIVIGSHWKLLNDAAWREGSREALLASGLISSGKGQVQVSVIVIGSHWKLLNDAAWREGSRQALLASGLISSGKGQVQDEAAGLVVALLDPQPGEDLLDACAAPGGKTLFSAARMQGQGSILALDIGRSRLAALRGMAARQQHGAMVSTHAADLRDFAPMLAQRRRQSAVGGEDAQQEVQEAQQGEREAAEAHGSADDQAGDSRSKPWPTQFDRVLLDAPCSGTGVLAKRADLRWRRTPEEVEQMAGLQGQLLAAAASVVKPGGLLVYSTCSLEAVENQQQVSAFLANHPDFSVEPPPAETGIPPKCVSPEGYLLMLPHVHGTDGAFAVRLRRRGDSDGGSGSVAGCHSHALQGQG
ncbi:Ribosomal RNA small subunit methyltransferase B isoform A [Chlorella sorokiniana]|uniref:Ribosomal RNA small subunit methyltransferase B isoform A n=1 Tax=Chlorella sorokiniana TaxID=3076 RepID=A0A2P6TG98_CHLSO|nr:Ribosomal RNA small subunit methyltransferase B isoform A [Chlorella sorokiniana]|eukprot:PRW33141.1 Ribosomal RNA small subunit methyltransferase B isoform A [Chlorella sorokiniana]